MNRRVFLWSTGSAGVLGVLPFTGCRALERLVGDDRDSPEASPMPANVVVGDEHLIFDPSGSAYELDVESHVVHRLEASARRAAPFGRLGTDRHDLNHPVDAAIGSDGELYVLDRGNHRIQVFDADGAHQRSIGGSGGALHLPHDMAVAGNRIYVCDTLQHRIQVFDSGGRHLSSIGDAEGEHALNGPSGIAVAANGELHVIESGDATVQVFTGDGEPLRRYGGYGTEPGAMLNPRSIVIQGDRVHIADPMGGHVHTFTTAGDFVTRFEPRDAAGQRVLPKRISSMHDGGLYVWTGGHRGHP